MADLGELHRHDPKLVNPLAKPTWCQVFGGPIRDRDHPDAGTQGTDHMEYFRHPDLCCRFRMVVSDKNQLRGDVTESLYRCLNGPNEHRLIPMRREPIGEFEAKAHILLHNHDTGSPIVPSVHHSSYLLSLSPQSCDLTIHASAHYLKTTKKTLCFSCEVKIISPPTSLCEQVRSHPTPCSLLTFLSVLGSGED